VTAGIAYLSYGEEIRYERANAMRYEHRLHQIASAINRYTDNNQNRLPLAKNWCDLLLAECNEISAETFGFSAVPEKSCDFVFNYNLSGLDINDMPNNTVLLFVAKGTWNQAGGENVFSCQKGRIRLVLFVDGEVGEYDVFRKGARMVYPSKTFFRNLMWNVKDVE
jgi:hypothetical protein